MMNFAERRDEIAMAIANVEMSNTKRKAVVSMLGGWNGERIIAKYGGDVVAAAKAAASLPSGLPVAQFANLTGKMA